MEENQLDGNTLAPTLDETLPPTPPKEKAKRGFAKLSQAELTAISRKGGIAAHAAGTGHKFTSEEGRRASALAQRKKSAKGVSSST